MFNYIEVTHWLKIQVNLYIVILTDKYMVNNSQKIKKVLNMKYKYSDLSDQELKSKFNELMIKLKNYTEMFSKEFAHRIANNNDFGDINLECKVELCANMYRAVQSVNLNDNFLRGLVIDIIDCYNSDFIELINSDLINISDVQKFNTKFIYWSDQFSKYKL